MKMLYKIWQHICNYSQFSVLLVEVKTKQSNDAPRYIHGSHNSNKNIINNNLVSSRVKMLLIQHLKCNLFVCVRKRGEKESEQLDLEICNVYKIKRDTLYKKMVRMVLSCDPFSNCIANRNSSRMIK